MTKRLTPEEKQRRKKERKKKKREEKRKAEPAVTSAPVGTNKPDTPPEDTTKTQDTPAQEDQPAPAEEVVHLCEDCAYEFGECQGTPKFASEEDDRVIECPAFLNVADMPTSDKPTVPGPAAVTAAPEEPPPEVEAEDQAQEEDEEDEAELTPEVQERLQRLREQHLPDRPDPNRFKQEEDFGNCPTCSRPLKRTAYSTYVDAIRCVNPRCGSYRNIVKTVPTGLK